MLGIQRGTVALYPHEEAWEKEAERTISCLKKIMGPSIADIQHVGSTSVPGIMAKPIIDIAMAVFRFDDVLTRVEELKAHGFYYRSHTKLENQLLLACGSYYDGTGQMQTHFIHVVLKDSPEWWNYIRFRDYLRQHPDAVREYEALKLRLCAEAPAEAGRTHYTEGKTEFVQKILQKASTAG